jgi:hypothetical protein
MAAVEAYFHLGGAIFLGDVMRLRHLQQQHVAVKI